MRTSQLQNSSVKLNSNPIIKVDQKYKLSNHIIIHEFFFFYKIIIFTSICFLIKKYDGSIRATFGKSKMARIEADKEEGGIRIASMASNRSYLEKGKEWKRRSREWLTTVSMLTKGIKVFEYVRLCQVSFLLRGHVLRFAQRATDVSTHFLDIRCLRVEQRERENRFWNFNTKCYKYIWKYFLINLFKRKHQVIFTRWVKCFSLKILLIN